MDITEAINKNKEIGKFINYISLLEGFKTQCKTMHWGILHTTVNSYRGAHLYLDDFLKIISDYQDMIAETSQGILGNYIKLDSIKGILGKSVNSPIDFCNEIENKVFEFYNNLENIKYIGIKSETETFIKDIQQFKYLFSLC